MSFSWPMMQQQPTVQTGNISQKMDIDVIKSIGTVVEASQIANTGTEIGVVNIGNFNAADFDMHKFLL